ncbi:HD domain-containing protein [Candidatus Pacearchaeota archaeon]|nr:HD domain-containing protein [Candidatus Pacearchaeota archaeon]
MNTHNANWIYSRSEQIAPIARALMPQLSYHNWRHVQDVASSVETIARREGVSEESVALLRATAYLHDVTYLPFDKQNEERSASLAGLVLTNLDFAKSEVDLVQRLVLETKVPQKPTDLLGRLICDADVANFGREDFLERGEEVRTELSIPQTAGWYAGCLKLLESHSFHTSAGASLYNAGKEKNIAKLREIVAQYEEKS